MAPPSVRPDATPRAHALRWFWCLSAVGSVRELRPWEPRTVIGCGVRVSARSDGRSPRPGHRQPGSRPSAVTSRVHRPVSARGAGAAGSARRSAPASRWSRAARSSARGCGAAGGPVCSLFTRLLPPSLLSSRTPFTPPFPPFPPYLLATPFASTVSPLLSASRVRGVGASPAAHSRSPRPCLGVARALRLRLVQTRSPGSQPGAVTRPGLPLSLRPFTSTPLLLSARAP